MLKAQIRSKIGALGPGWRDIEDILTGDFFGALDYLPRRPFLAGFLEWVARLNETVKQPPREGVDWDGVEFNFWPMVKGEDEAAEPDVVIVSDHWVLVVEVKLDSALGRVPGELGFLVHLDVRGLLRGLVEYRRAAGRTAPEVPEGGPVPIAVYGSRSGRVYQAGLSVELEQTGILVDLMKRK